MGNSLETTDPSPKRILVIEDRPQLNHFLAQLLEHLGYSVVTAANGLEGIKCLHALSFDLVITDIFMPGKNGLEVICEIVEEFPKTRFIAMSGAEDSSALLAEARQLGAQYTFNKPFNTEDLLQAIQAEIGKP